MTESLSAELDALLGVGEGDSDQPSAPADAEVTEEEGSLSQDDEASASDESGEEVPSEEEESEVEEAAESEEETQPREARLAQALSRYKKYDPIIEAVEQDPALAREIVARRLGLSPKQQQQVQAPTHVDIEAEKKKWITRLQTDPAGAINDLIAFHTQQTTAPAKQASLMSAVESFKASRLRTDPLFENYEDIFDALVESTNPDVILANPKAALKSISSMALGTWVEDQRVRGAKATRGKPLTQPREKASPSLALPRGVGGRTAQAPKQRALSDEEKLLVERYGKDALDAFSEAE